jgi:hypothetical protein
VPKAFPDIILFKDGNHLYFQESHEDQELSTWIRIERWALNPLITTSNVYSISEDTNKKLVLGVIDIVDKFNATSENGR